MGPDIRNLQGRQFLQSVAAISENFEQGTRNWELLPVDLPILASTVVIDMVCHPDQQQHQF